MDIGKDLDCDFTDRQTEALIELNKSDPIVDVCYGGAKGGGKSHFLCLWVFLMLMAYIKAFDIKENDHPLHVGFMGRKQSVDFTGTTLQTWQRIIPADRYVIRAATDKHPKHILVDDRICVDIGGLDKSKTINKFNSAEYAFIAIDQAEETTQDDVSVLKASRRLTIKGKPLKYKGLWTANPAQCWLKSEFIENPRPSHTFVQALPADNPYLPPSYTQTLIEAFEYRPELLEAYLHGNWDAMDVPSQVILGKWLTLAKTIRFSPIKPRRFLSVDTARYGNDECVIIEFEETIVKDHEILPKVSADQLVTVLARRSMDAGKIPVVVEVVGADIGAAVSDFLTAMDIPVIQHCPQGAALQDEKFYNARAEAYWTVGDGFAKSQISIDGEYDRSFMQSLESQMCSVLYTFKGAKIIMELKQKLKERIGKSPDRADSYVQGIYKLLTGQIPYTEAEEEFVNNSKGVAVPSWIRG